MKKFRVWAYETWIEGNDGESDFIINKDNTEEIEVR